MGIILGVVAGLLISGFFYWLSLESRKPIFAVEPVRTKILSTNSMKAKPFKVLRNDGSEIKADVTSIRFYLWNAGNRSIKRNEVLRPVRIVVDDPNAKILSSEILSRSRDVTELSLTSDSQNRSQSLRVGFLIIERNDGLTGQIIYEGDPKATFSVRGAIEGVEAIGGIRSINRLQIFPFLILFIPIGGMSLFAFFWFRNEARKTGERMPKSGYWMFAGAFLAVFLPFSLVELVIARSDFVPQGELSQFVPQSVLPKNDNYPPTQDFDMR